MTHADLSFRRVSVCLYVCPYIHVEFVQFTMHCNPPVSLNKLIAWTAVNYMKSLEHGLYELIDVLTTACSLCHNYPTAKSSNEHKSSSNECRRLRSTDTVMLQVPPTRRSTLGDRAFPVAAARAWNGLAAACNMFLQLIAAVPARDKSISVPVVLLWLIGSSCTFPLTVNNWTICTSHTFFFSLIL